MVKTVDFVFFINATVNFHKVIAATVNLNHRSQAPLPFHAGSHSMRHPACCQSVNPAPQYRAAQGTVSPAKSPCLRSLPQAATGSDAVKFSPLLAFAQNFRKTSLIGSFAPCFQCVRAYIKPAADFLKRALQAAEVLELLLIYFLSWPCHTRPPFSQSAFSPPERGSDRL